MREKSGEKRGNVYLTEKRLNFIRENIAYLTTMQPIILVNDCLFSNSFYANQKG
jgi:hypothetical protein